MATSHTALNILLCLYGFTIALTSASPPNIIFILVDDWGWNDFSFHGGCDFLTPNLDNLASEALELTNYYVQDWCTATRSSILSGRYPMRDGLQDGVIAIAAPYGMPLNLTILPQELQRAGYDTHIVGKWHLGYFAHEYIPTERGFDTFLGYYSGEEDYYYKNRTKINDETLYPGVDFRNGSEPVLLGAYSTWIYGNETIRLLEKKLREKDDDPFFMYLPFQAAHVPFAAPGYAIDQFDYITSSYDRQVLAAVLSLLDDTIGEIIDYLQSSKSGYLWDDSIVIVSSDNGGDVSYDASNFPLRGSKGTLFEGGVKANGFVTGGWLPDERRGQKMNALMHATDWFVTLQSIAGLEPSVDYLLDGLDQFDNLYTGETDIYSPREILLHNIVSSLSKGAMRWRDYKIIRFEETGCKGTWCPLPDVNEDLTSIQCTPHGNYDYPLVNLSTTCPTDGDPCLFNIADDPCEYADVHDQEPEIFAMMLAMLEEFNRTQAEELYKLYPSDYAASSTDKFGGFWSPWVQLNDSPAIWEPTKQETETVKEVPLIDEVAWHWRLLSYLAVF